MNATTRTVLVMAIALITASLAAFAVYSAVARMPTREVEVAHQFIVVASKSMPTGSRVTTDDVKLVAWPSRNPVADSFTAIEDVVDRGLIASVVENEPLTARKLAPLESGVGLPPSIPEGMRAISVKVNEVIGVAGFVVPGTRVDVVVVVRQQNDSIARTVVTNVQVLTAGTRYDQEMAREGKPMQSTVVTLLVTPEDSERIALAQTEGQVTLTLRNPLDAAATSTAGVRTAALVGTPPTPPPPSQAPPRRREQRAATPPIAPPPPVPKAYTVETFRAAKRTEEVVKP